MKLSIISKFILSIKLRAPIKELRAAMRQQAGGRSGGLGVRLGAGREDWASQPPRVSSQPPRVSSRVSSQSQPQGWSSQRPRKQKVVLAM
jgi:hypothetical protein